MSEKAYNLELSLRELEALNKTVGIAVDNLTTKVNKHGAESALGRAAKSDRASLWSASVQIADALSEEYDNE